MYCPNKVKLMKNSKTLIILYPSLINMTAAGFPSNIASLMPDPTITTMSITARTIGGNPAGKLYNIPTVHNAAANSLNTAAMIRRGTNMDLTFS
jgi:hypothetical protein